MDAKSIEELSEFYLILLQRLRNNHPFVASFSRAIRSGDVTNLLETMSRLSDKVCRKGHVLH